MKNAPGYPLPSGELGSDDIVCQLVFLPDRPEYWQAFYAALHYMTTWRAWERDDDKRGKDAAANWREAFELTSECWRMACLEQLQDDVSEILAIMQLGQSCCDEMDVTDGDQYTDRVVDGEGDVPQNIIDAGYASGTSDWAGFDDYKCMIAHVIVNQLSARLNELNELVNEYGAVAGGAAAIAAILAVIFAASGIAIVFGLVAGVGAVSLLYQSLMGFPLLGNLADKVDTNHDELACAVYYSDGDADALDSLNTKIDQLFTTVEALILKNLNLGPTLKALYAGRYDQQDIAEILYDAGYELIDFDCSCDVQIGEYLEYTDFETETLEGWNETDFYVGGGYGIQNFCAWCLLISGHNEKLWLSTGAIRAFAGLSPTAGKKTWINRVSFWYRFNGANGGLARLTMEHDGGTFMDTYAHTETWTFVQETFSPPLQSTHQMDYIVQLTASSYPGIINIDQITVDFDSEDD